MKYSDLLFTFADLIHAYRKRKGEKTMYDKQKCRSKTSSTFPI